VAAEYKKIPTAAFMNAFESLFRCLLQYWEDNDGVSERYLQVVQDLHTLGWIRPLSKTRAAGFLLKTLQSAIRKSILLQIKETIQGQFDIEGLYQSVCDWRDRVVNPWMQSMLWPENKQGVPTDDTLVWKQDLDLLTAQCFCEVRMEEIFDVVADYSDSHPSVMELKEVLEITKMHNELANVLGKQLIKRLNHPGANTSQIIDVYITTIKVLRVIDPSDRLLEIVAEPVRSYLRGRADTVRCIISSLTDAQVGGDLYQELRRQDAKPLENVTVDSDDEEECPDMNWQPQPSIYKPRGTFLEGTGGRGDGDILAMLVSIYGSKELFVNEYRLMLADKLLANLNYDTDQDVHTLELLKLRFG
jgi:anaphase-promoting complex subunit 2